MAVNFIMYTFSARLEWLQILLRIHLVPISNDCKFYYVYTFNAYLEQLQILLCIYI